MADQNTTIVVPSYTDILRPAGDWYRRDDGDKISRIIVQQGRNNKELRPCSDYHAAYQLSEYGTTMRYYSMRGNPAQLTLTQLSVGPRDLVSWVPAQQIRKGSLAEAQRRLYGQTLNLAMTAKDLYDANKMATDWFHRMTRAAPFLKRRQFSKAYAAFFGNKSVSKNAANTWLEFQFGVMPTKQAVQDAYTTYANTKVPEKSIQVNGVPSCFRMLARSRNEYITREPTPYMVYPAGSRKERYQAIRYLSKDDIRSAMYRFNPVEVLWDATPWSFVVDWFIPMGDWLKQFGYLTTTHCDGCDTSSIVTSVHGKAYSPFNGSTYQEWLVDSDHVTVNRKKNPNLEFSMSLSEMMNKSVLGLSCKRTAHAFALCRQRFSGKGWW